MKAIRKIKNRKGQAGVEFISIVVVVFFFLFFFASLSFVLVVSDYMEYATFMAARTYKAAASAQDVQLRRATEVFNSYAERIQGIARNFRIQVVNNEPNRNQTEGLLASYEVDLFYLPPVFIQAGTGQAISRLPLATEVHLGREPSATECQQFFNNFSSRLGLGIEGSGLVGIMEDNGC